MTLLDEGEQSCVLNGDPWDCHRELTGLGWTDRDGTPAKIIALVPLEGEPAIRRPSVRRRPTVIDW